ncbi:MAG TPA: hypothetical protein DDZ40_08490, partial [Deltaproteobacteria bacterium]|nr:hypothetical protein [Deltaproteobacteria bacterium]
MLSLRENLAIIAGQCVERMQEITQRDPEDTGTYAVMARSLFEAMAESMETRDPGRFLSSIDAHWDAITECPGDLPHMIAAMEELVMEWKIDAEDTRFLWALFRQARLKSTSTGHKIPETAGQKLAETLQTLRKEIEDRRKAEKKLRESERRFRDIAEFMPQVIFEIDDKGSVVFVNKQAFEFFGYKESDLPPHFNCFAHITPEDFPRMMANLRKVADGVRSPGNEYTALKKDGSRFPVIIYVTRIMNGDRLTGYRGIIIDITERKKAEEELRRAHKELDDRNSFLNALLAAIPTPVFYKDKEGRYLGCNQTFTDQMGLASEEMEGRTAFDLWSAQSADILQREDRAMMETGKPRVYEKQITDREGNERSVIFNKNVYRCADGTVAGIVGSYIDITQQKLARQSLEESEKMYRTFFDSTTDIVFLKDEKLHYVLANKVLLDFFGKKEQEVLGTTDFTLMP